MDEELLVGISQSVIDCIAEHPTRGKPKVSLPTWMTKRARKRGT